MATQNKNKKGNPYRPNVWGMIQYIAIAAINKGQIIPLGVLLALLILFLKLPTERAAEILKDLINLFETYHILVWIFSVLLLIGLLYNGKRLRRNHAQEIERLSEEKKQLQQLLAKKKLSTSK